MTPQTLTCNPADNRKPRNGSRALLSSLLPIPSSLTSAVDNRFTVVELDGTLCTNQYDASSQITYEARSGTYAYARSYVWDPLGNRLKQYDSGALTTGTFNAANQQTLISPPTGAPTTQTYDNAGNLILQNTGGALVTQSWSPENRIIGYASASENESYVCSDDGLRRQQTTASGVTNLTFDEMLVLLETSATGLLQASYTDQPRAFGRLVSQNRSGTSSFHGYDSAGNTRILTSATGAITDSYSSKAFGEPLQTGGGTTNPHVFGGKYRYRLQSWGGQLLSVRIEDPTTGRLTSVDPIGFLGGDWNVYRIVDNNPVRSVDPTGLLPMPVPREEPEPEPYRGPGGVPYMVPLYEDSSPFDPIAIRNFYFMPGAQGQTCPVPAKLLEPWRDPNKTPCDKWLVGGLPDPCDWADQNGDVKYNMRGGGAVFCCKGIPYPCVYLKPSQIAKPGGGLLRRCILIHEESHMYDPEQPCPRNGTGWLQNRDNTAYSRKNVGECNAYRDEWICLDVSYQYCNTLYTGLDRLRCKHMLLAELYQVCSRLKKYCANGSGYPGDCMASLRRLIRTK